MNHKISTYAIIGIMLITLLTFVVSLESGDIDEVCNMDNSTLYRYNGTWVCGSLSDVIINYTINNITILTQNYSLYSNNSFFLNGKNNNTISVNNSNCWKGDCGGFRAQVNQNVNTTGTPTFASETLNQGGLGTWVTFSFVGIPIGVITSALGAFQFQAQNNFDYYLTNDDLSAILTIKDNGQITATGTNFQVPTVADFNVSRTSIYNNFTLSGIADFNKSRVSIYNNMTVTGYINATRDVCVTNGNCLNKTIAPVNTPYKNNTITYWNNNTRVWDILQGPNNNGYLAQCSGALMWLSIGAVCPI